MEHVSHTLIIDGMCMLHRANSGFTVGDNYLTFNFIRSIKSIIEKLEPDNVIIALEGHPKKRYELLPEYKENRVVEENTPEHDAKKKFYAMCERTMKLVAECLPIAIVRHDDHEADDTIANIVFAGSKMVKYTIVSTDTDYIQLLDLENVHLYNPVKKSFVSPEISGHDYVVWKALRGDKSDNVPPVDGFTDSNAKELALDQALFREIMSNDEKLFEQFNRNMQLISFARWDDDERMKMISSEPVWNRSLLKQRCEEMHFKSLCGPGKEKTWDAMCAVFKKLA